MREDELIERLKGYAITAVTSTETLKAIEVLGELGRSGEKYKEKAVDALIEIAKRTFTITESQTAMEEAQKIIKEHF